jgi:hypothetical protein
MPDNEHASPSLGDSEVLSIENPPRHAVPEFNHLVEKSGEVSSAIGRE